MQQVSSSERSGILAGLITRKELIAQLDVCRMTVCRYEKQGMPVIRRGKGRFYEPAAVRAWFVSGSAT